MFIETDGIRLYYEKSGRGRPLILLHGNGEDHTIFTPAVRRLQNHFTVYAMDTRSHGKSQMSSDIHYRTFMEDLRKFILCLQLKAPMIAGFSDGAITALMLGYTYPEIPASIVAAGANTSPDMLVEAMQEEIQDAFNASGDPLLRLMLNEPDIRREDLERIAVPVLVTAGEHDAVKREDTLFIARSVPHSKLIILAGEDHASYIAGSEKIADIILREMEFLAGTPAI